MKPLEVFLDEGALDGDARFPSAGAVIVGDAADASEQIEELMLELSLQPDFRLEPKADKLERVGFHHVEDNVLAKSRFKSLLPRLDFDWLSSANLHVGDEDPYDLLPVQFEWVVRRTLQKYRGRNLHFIFEQNQRMQAQFAGIVEAAAAATGTTSDSLSTSIGTKNDRALAIADYCIAISTQAIKVWMEQCCDNLRLGKDYRYRDFAAIEPSCSTLFAADLRRSVSNRAARMIDHTYFDVSGLHSASCTKAAST
ncbi:hypothetical protein V1638_10040 [Pseudarthrobacter sp. J64]|uniref:hypothetical protein n=1 Tax=Pseudarthrobacter sp. J64 TaxID=3116485 RepID=UPI002E8217A2|nr:hypothetical protein [Pseudarthrobacter sp. J64]MEE2569732.1 hypothetical protein [Pseudarthrobacter sp. J64]